MCTPPSCRWNTLRNPSTVRTLLKLVYADKTAVDRDTELIENIIEPTQRPIVRPVSRQQSRHSHTATCRLIRFAVSWNAQARDVFCSIFLSPKTRLSFNEMLQQVKCPVALVYGKEDPWCEQAAPPHSCPHGEVNVR